MYNNQADIFNWTIQHNSIQHTTATANLRKPSYANAGTHTLTHVQNVHRGKVNCLQQGRPNCCRHYCGLVRGPHV